MTDKKKRGWAALTPEQRTELARKAGKASQASGNAHRFDSDEAREAGKVGGASVSQNREFMSQIGKKGGVASGESKRARKQETDNE